MFSSDLSTAPLDEQLPRTSPQNSRYSRRTFFSQRELNGGIYFSPSACRIPERRRTGETPFELSTPHAHRTSPSSLSGTSSAYGATSGPSRAPRGMPGLRPFPRRDLSFEATPQPSPTSMVAQRKIITPKGLRPEFNQAQKSKDGTDFLDTSLLGAATTPIHHPTTPFGSHSDLSAVPMDLTDPVVIPPPSNISPLLQASPTQNDVAAVYGVDSDGEEEADAEEDVADEDQGVNHHTQWSNNHVHSQQGAQNESTDDDGNVWLPFPYDRDSLAIYLERGLSLRYLFPSSTQGDHTRCEAELVLVGGLWRHDGICHKSEGSRESYQRHVKIKHLGVKRGKEIGLRHIVNTVWGYNKTIPIQPKTSLRVQPWVPNSPGFQLAA